MSLHTHEVQLKLFQESLQIQVLYSALNCAELGAFSVFASGHGAVKTAALTCHPGRTHGVNAWVSCGGQGTRRLEQSGHTEGVYS